MKIRYISDIHLELLSRTEYEDVCKKIQLNKDSNEVLILAGDIGNPFFANYRTFLNLVHLQFKKVFLITGNHEYYKNKIPKTDEMIQSIVNQFPNISFLNNSYEIYEGYCFIGSTLWSFVKNPEYMINDIRAIQNFSVDQYNQLHQLSRKFLEETVSMQKNCIVITHHLPSYSLVDPKYLTYPMSLYNQWFASNFDEFIQNNNKTIKAWFYGHTHSPSEKTISGVPMLCNPMGYPGENQIKDFGKTFTLSLA